MWLNKRCRPQPPSSTGLCECADERTLFLHGQRVLVSRLWAIQHHNSSSGPAVTLAGWSDDLQQPDTIACDTPASDALQKQLSLMNHTTSGIAALSFNC